MQNMIEAPIVSVRELLKEIAQTPLQGVGALMKRLKLPKDELSPFTSWSDDKYTRNGLFNNGIIEVIALCWKPGQATPIHGHGGQKCWVYQVEGAVQEKRFEWDGAHLLQAEIETLNQGAFCYIDDDMGYHLIENNSAESAVSLHFYAAPIKQCEVFNEDKNKFESKDLEYDFFMKP